MRNEALVKSLMIQTQIPLGRPYSQKGSFPLGTLWKDMPYLDCSEYVKHCFHLSGVNQVHNYNMRDGATSQRNQSYEKGVIVTRDYAMKNAGVLCFYSSKNPVKRARWMHKTPEKWMKGGKNHISAPHVGISMGNGRIIHSWSKGVKESNIWSRFDVFIDLFQTTSTVQQQEPSTPTSSKARVAPKKVAQAPSTVGVSSSPSLSLPIIGGAFVLLLLLLFLGGFLS